MLESLDAYSGYRYHLAFSLAETQLLDYLVRKYPPLYPALMAECGEQLRLRSFPPPQTEEEKELLRLFRKKWKRLRSRAPYDLRFLGIPLASRTRSMDGMEQRILGIPVWKKEVGQKYIVKRLLGIPIQRKVSLAWRLRHGNTDAR